MISASLAAKGLFDVVRLLLRDILSRVASTIPILRAGKITLAGPGGFGASGIGGAGYPVVWRIPPMKGTDTPEDSLRSEMRKETRRDAQALVKLEILRLVNALNHKGIKPKVHGEDLLVFGDNQNALVEFIQKYSILKRLEDIRRILLWRLNASSAEGVPLGSIPSRKKEAGEEEQGFQNAESILLYDSIFNQSAYMAARGTDPLRLVLFRRGHSSRELTGLLQTLPNVQLKVIVSATDDGLSWYHAAREFQAPGVPGAGKALLDLANDDHVREFLQIRLKGDRLTSDTFAGDFKTLILKMENPSQHLPRLSDEMQSIYQSAMRMEAKKRKQLAKYLSVFWDAWEALSSSQFVLSGVPIRSLVLLGAAKAAEKSGAENYWQQAVNQVGEILDIGEHQVILPTARRQHLVALRSDGTLYYSETAINDYDAGRPFEGLWLVDAEHYSEFYANLERKLNEREISLKRLHQKELEGKVRGRDASLTGEILSGMAKIDPQDTGAAGDILSKLTAQSTSTLAPEAQRAIKDAEIILYADALLETNVGGALIVPGMRDAIADNQAALQVNLAEIEKVKPDHNMPLDYLCYGGFTVIRWERDGR